MQILAGAAQVDITPPIGVWMCGYAFRPTGCIGIHDPLTARALVVSDGSNTVALVAMDLLGLDFDLVERIRAGVKSATGISSEAVMLHATHTHGGPNVREFNCMGSRDPEYTASLVSKLVRVTSEAASHLVPVKLAYGRAPVQIGINRRQIVDGKCIIGENPDGPVAPYVHVVTVRRTDGRPIALLFSHACHPTTLGGDNLLITSDFCGDACEHVSEELGTDIIPFFLQGCAGNINPSPRGTFENANNHGKTLGKAALTAILGETPIEGPISFEETGVSLPQIPPPSIEFCRDEVDTWTEAVERELQTGDQGRFLHAQGLLDFAKLSLAASRSGRSSFSVPFRIQALRIAGLTILGLPAEMFVQYGLDFEQIESGPVLALGYTNGVHGYMPTAADYPLGGYEVDVAYKYYGSLMFAPASERIVRSTAYDLLGAPARLLTPYNP